MLKHRLPAVLLAAVVVFVPAACRKNETPAAAEAAAASLLQGTMPVKVETVSRQRISEKMTFTGVVEAARKINITPETSGKVARIVVEEGQFVQKGQLLAELDTASILLQLQQAEAAAAMAEANAKNSARNKERMDRLMAENAVSETQFEQVKLADEAAQAQAAQARAAVALIRRALDQAVMTAPWNGVIASRNAEVGDILNPMMGGYGSSGSGVVTLVDYGRVKIIVEVTQDDILRLARGQKAVVRSGSAEAAGMVSVVNLAADPLSKKFRVEILADNPGLVLRPGTFGSVTFEVNSHENALAVHQKAVLSDSYVFTAENGKAVKRPVTLGLKNTTMIEVIDGLKEGDQVIVEGNFGLVEGTPVEIKR
ncbi:MAG: efflux RND transporter periplasmic adaptor subunit [Acidobacteriota bacterium]|nr:efflux RND transporter periplasmic adaptor subunit [Acidobacteriota bacterium]OQB57530.1 MAG: Efflux pump periplasmic linker BepF [Candidatus Aminicenantes bacterium ADurb.Bin147]HNQ80130.1 efflux RND transporter periplasmic adaptor subunit [Candidatus Aminicenantes bacterium]MDD8009499.1 efflux RND transporter periplasmic adaptor subunit [Acidobacteriota bacterium]MDD8028639.1 efflux RND transporter periplasmic adaptor subunit [Acidobacteriota bacterium]